MRSCPDAALEARLELGVSGGHPTAAGGAVRGCVRVRVLPDTLSAGARCGSPFAAMSRAEAAQPPADRAPAVLGGVRVCWMEVPAPVSPELLQADGEPCHKLTPWRGLLPGRGVLQQRRALPRCISAW